VSLQLTIKRQSFLCLYVFCSGGSGEYFSSAQFVSGQVVGDSALFALASTNSNCDVSVQMVTVNFNTWTVHPNGSPTCLATVNKVKSVSVSTILFQHGESSDFCSSDDFSMVGIVAVSNHEKEIYSTMFCADNEGNIDSPPLLQLSSLDVGEDPRISLAYQGSSLVALEVHGHGYCWNNEDNNKRAETALCDSIPRSQRLVLSYNFGTLEAWQQHIANEIPMSPCDDMILHGVYDLGTFSSICTFYDKNGDLSFLEVHTGVSELDLVDAFVCGMATPSGNAFILDSWNLPSAPMSS